VIRPDGRTSIRLEGCALRAKVDDLLGEIRFGPSAKETLPFDHHPPPSAWPRCSPITWPENGCESRYLQLGDPLDRAD